MENTEKLIILGSGPAGYSASIYAARAGLNPTLITGFEVGGQLTTTTDVENWPGDYEDLQGPDLMIRMQNHAKKYGVNIVNDQIEKVDLGGEIKTLEGMNKYSCKSLIITTGASAKYLGLSSEEKYLGKGVSACATCDGFFYKDEEVAVVGGGNTAAEEALYLTNLCKKVHLIHRRDSLRAEKILQDRIFEKANEGKINLIWNNELKEIKGDGNIVTHLNLSNYNDIQVKGVFIAIGHNPNTEIFKNQIDMKDGYILINTGLNGNVTGTSVPGVFAAGDVADSVYRQAITSAGFGCMAALDAQKFIEENNI
ncbi:MAG: thioredoxin-disulfide reductase [Gammaproteobacteria bacterium]|nr:thioredoxin-disulfide reductase [Gammaproteobacteria bacterium]